MEAITGRHTGNTTVMIQKSHLADRTDGQRRGRQAFHNKFKEMKKSEWYEKE